MAYWTSRTYHCKSCKNKIEIKRGDAYICSTCNEPIFTPKKGKSPNLGFNFMARTTKMEFSEESPETNMHRFATGNHENHT